MMGNNMLPAKIIVFDFIKKPVKLEIVKETSTSKMEHVLT